jgi:hypothetical protein
MFYLNEGTKSLVISKMKEFLYEIDVPPLTNIMLLARKTFSLPKKQILDFFSFYEYNHKYLLDDFNYPDLK